MDSERFCVAVVKETDTSSLVGLRNSPYPKLLLGFGEHRPTKYSIWLGIETVIDWQRGGSVIHIQAAGITSIRNIEALWHTGATGHQQWPQKDRLAPGSSSTPLSCKR